jgi:hypothetical protein
VRSASRGSATCIIIVSNGEGASVTTFQSSSWVRSRTTARDAPLRLSTDGEALMPDALLLDHGVKLKRRGPRRWKAKVNQIAKFVARESEGKADGSISRSALNREVSLLYGAGNGLWTRPQCGL